MTTCYCVTARRLIALTLLCLASGQGQCAEATEVTGAMEIQSEFSDVRFKKPVSVHSRPARPVVGPRAPQNAGGVVNLRQAVPLSGVRTEEKLIEHMDVYALSPAARLLTHRMVPRNLLLPQNRAMLPTPARWRELAEQAAAAHGLNPRLIAAVIRAESSFQVDAVSPKGAQGLMQLMPETGAELGLRDPFDPAANVDAGTRYLKQQLERFGSTELALAAYNAGPQAVIRHSGIPPFAETQAFVSRVMRYATGD